MKLIYHNTEEKASVYGKEYNILFKNKTKNCITD